MAATTHARLQPNCKNGRRGAEPIPEAVVARDETDAASARLGWSPEGVALALDDQRLHGNNVELRLSARTRLGTLTLRRLQRKREAQHTDGAGRSRRSTRDPRPGGATTDDERQLVEPLRAEPLDGRHPRDVELPRGRRRAPAGDAIRLLDEGDRQASREADLFGLD